MDTDARHSGLRAKRCLPAEFHRRLPTTDRPNAHISVAALRERLVILFARYPQVAATINFASNSANSRFFTDCYPIYAAFETNVNQTGATPEVLRAVASNQRIDN